MPSFTSYKESTKTTNTDRTTYFRNSHNKLICTYKIIMPDRGAANIPIAQQEVQHDDTINDKGVRYRNHINDARYGRLCIKSRKIKTLTSHHWHVFSNAHPNELLQANRPIDRSIEDVKYRSHINDVRYGRPCIN